jgi:hypothetical protein
MAKKSLPHENKNIPPRKEKRLPPRKEAQRV